MADYRSFSNAAANLSRAAVNDVLRYAKAGGDASAPGNFYILEAARNYQDRASLYKFMLIAVGHKDPYAQRWLYMYPPEKWEKFPDLKRIPEESSLFTLAGFAVVGFLALMKGAQMTGGMGWLVWLAAFIAALLGCWVGSLCDRIANKANGVGQPPALDAVSKEVEDLAREFWRHVRMIYNDDRSAQEIGQLAGRLGHELNEMLTALEVGKIAATEPETVAGAHGMAGFASAADIAKLAG